MSTTIGAATSGSRPGPISVTYGRLQRIGFGDAEAANIAALENGFEFCSRFRSMAGPTAALDLLRPSAALGLDAAGDPDREGG